MGFEDVNPKPSKGFNGGLTNYVMASFVGRIDRIVCLVRLGWVWIKLEG